MVSAGKYVSAMVMVSLVISIVVVPPAAALSPLLTCITVLCPAQCKFNPFCLIPCVISCRNYHPSTASEWQQLEQSRRTPISSSCLEGCVLSNCVDVNTNGFHLNQGEAMRRYKGCVNGCDVSCNNDDLH